MKSGSRIGLAILTVGIGLLMLASNSAAAANVGGSSHSAATTTGRAVPGCGGVNFVYYAVGWYNNTTYWGCTLHAKDWQGHSLPSHGWGLSIYEVYCSTPCNSRITVSDIGYVGDYYTLYVTDSSALTTGWGEVGATPQVKTSSELNASSYNSHWTGTGTKSSSASFVVYDPGGVAEYFAVVDSLMGKMTHSLDGPCGVSATTLLSSGCTATGIYVSGAWSPAGFDIDFAAYP